MPTLPTLSMSAFPESLRLAIPKVLYRRFSEREHAESFLEKGEMWLRSILYHRGVEGEDDPRADPREGTYQNKLPEGTICQIQMKPDEQHVTVGSATHYKQELQEPYRCFIYCFSEQQHQTHADKFGQHLVTVHNTDELFRRITNGALQKGNINWGSVRYYDETKEENLFLFENISFDGTPIWRVKPKNISMNSSFGLQWNFTMLINYGKVA